MKNFLLSFLLFLGLWCASALASHLDRGLESSRPGFGAQDALNRFIGGIKEGIGDTLFLKADAYFHGGVSGHGAESAVDLVKEGQIHETHAETADKSDWISKINHEVKAHEHYHLKRDEKKEMLPFLALATRLDPYNIDAILTTSYWLSDHLGKDKEAIEVLEKGIENNPSEWALEASLAALYLKKIGDYPRAIAHYQQAIHKALKKNTEQNEVADLYSYLGDCYIKEGNTILGMEAFRAALDLLTDVRYEKLKSAIRLKINRLAPS